VWKKWYRVLVEAPDGRKFLIAIEAHSALEARRRVAADWGGEERIREVKS
jgi:hypothetical protein